MAITLPEELDPLRASATELWRGVLARLPFVVIALVVVALSFALAAGVRWAIQRATRARRRANIGVVLGRLCYFATILLGFLVAVTIVAPSMTPAKLVSILGIGGVAIGFAFKDLFQNLVAGMLILWREPFRIGDEITAGAFTGTVEGIETRATLIKTYDGRRIIIPNSTIYTESVQVITAYDLLRSEYDVGIGYGDDVAKAKELLAEILRTTDGVLAKPRSEVFVWDLAGSTVNLRIRWWSRPDRPTVVALRDRVLGEVRERLPAAGIDLAYPTQVVLFHDQTEETDGDRAKQREGWPARPGDEAPRPARLASGVGRVAERHLDPTGSDGADSPQG